MLLWSETLHSRPDLLIEPNAPSSSLKSHHSGTKQQWHIFEQHLFISFLAHVISMFPFLSRSSCFPQHCLSRPWEAAHFLLVPSSPTKGQSVSLSSSRTSGNVNGWGEPGIRARPYKLVSGRKLEGYWPHREISKAWENTQQTGGRSESSLIRGPKKHYLHNMKGSQRGSAMQL